MGQVSQGQPALKRRHIAAATLGNALEFYDFLTYSFFAIQIGHAFFPGRSGYGSLMLSLATFAAGFVARPFGAVVIGAYADRAGRRPAMLLSFLLIGVSIVAMALIPPYSVIGIMAPVLAILARVAQGFSLGGEIGSNTAYLLEAAAPEKRGQTVAWQGASQCAALFAASIVGILLTSFMPAALLDAWGWRIAFLLGAVTVPFGLWLRSNLPETLHTNETPSPLLAADAASLTRLQLARRHTRIMALGLVALGAATISNYVCVYAVTFAQDTLHLSARIGFVAESANTLIGIPAILLGGWLSDRYGRWPVNVGNNLALIVLTWPIFVWMTEARSQTALIVGMTILGVLINLPFGGFLAALGESLPKRIRVTSFATVYSLAIATLGGTTQFVVTWLIHVTGSPMAPAFYMIGAALIGQVALMLIPESAPVRLRRDAVLLAASPA
jgi:MHS family citrate/tricarballylate:H+ symporter-like MFS transporter